MEYGSSHFSRDALALPSTECSLYSCAPPLRRKGPGVFLQASFPDPNQVAQVVARASVCSPQAAGDAWLVLPPSSPGGEGVLSWTQGLASLLCHWQCPCPGCTQPPSFQWSLSVVWERRDKWSLSTGEKRLSSRHKESHEPEVGVYVCPRLRKKQDSFPWRQWLGCDGCDEVFPSTSWGASGIPGSFSKKFPAWIFLSSATNS